MLWRWKNTILRFMQGRYGSDPLNRFLLWMYLALWFVQMFVRTGIAAKLLALVSAAVAVWVLYRALSRNIERRRAENDRFMRLRAPISAWCKRMFVRLRDIRHWRYRKCPYCSARLRLPLKRGKRTVTCSRCNGQFSAFFW